MLSVLTEEVVPKFPTNIYASVFQDLLEKTARNYKVIFNRRFQL